MKRLSFKVEIDLVRADDFGFGLTVVPANGLVVGLGRYFIDVNWRRN